MRRVYITPEGERSPLYNDMLSQVHLLIAGATGSGKSTVVNGIMHAAMFQSPARINFVLIDPKGTELDEYKRLPHTICYAQTTDECVNALEQTLQLVNNRFWEMRRKKQRMYDGSDVYVIIDELMYLFNRSEIKRRAMNLLQDILVIARAARVHVIACTQSPTERTGLPVNLRCNFDSRLALRTSTAQDSRNIIGVKGCECFPVPTLEHKAYGAYMQNGCIQVYNLDQIPDAARADLIRYWTGRNGRARLRIFAH